MDGPKCKGYYIRRLALRQLYILQTYMCIMREYVATMFAGTCPLQSFVFIQIIFILMFFLPICIYYTLVNVQPQQGARHFRFLLAQFPTQVTTFAVKQNRNQNIYTFLLVYSIQCGSRLKVLRTQKYAGVIRRKRIIEKSTDDGSQSL